MKKVMYNVTIIFSALTIAAYIIFKFTQNDIFQILYITFMTFSYHFVMRLVVGLGIGKVHPKEFDYHARWFHPRPFEKKLYKALKVKKWKAYVPAWAPENFETKYHTLPEIVSAMCNAEVVHEVIIVLSFVPILFSIEYGVPMVFIITSIFAALIDTVFVIIQRYNRPRIVKLIGKQK